MKKKVGRKIFFWMVSFMMTVGKVFLCCAGMFLFQEQGIFTINNAGIVSAEGTARDSWTLEEGISQEAKTAISVRKVKLQKKSNRTYTEKGKVQKKIRTKIIDRQKTFQQIFEREKGRYTKYNKAYVLQNSSEYFAESFKDYTLEPKKLKADRPLTYAAVRDALDGITVTQMEKVQKIYQAVWGNAGI